MFQPPWESRKTHSRITAVSTGVQAHSKRSEDSQPENESLKWLAWFGVKQSCIQSGSFLAPTFSWEKPQRLLDLGISLPRSQRLPDLPWDSKQLLEGGLTVLTATRLICGKTPRDSKGAAVEMQGKQKSRWEGMVAQTSVVVVEVLRSAHIWNVFCRKCQKSLLID